MAKKKPSKPLLMWSKRPTVTREGDMGVRRRWLGRGRLLKYAVTQYRELTGQCISTVWTPRGWTLLDTKGTLRAAQQVCEADAKTRRKEQ